MRTLTFILFGLLVAFNAHAVHRTFVAASGTDSGACGPTTPCRTLDYAMSQTDERGEVIITESGGYGSTLPSGTQTGGITITKSISIIAEPGIFAALAPTAGNNGITIATPGIEVVINGLFINGRGGTYGIYMTNGSSLTVIDCNLSNFGYTSVWPEDAGGAAIYINTPAKLTITNTIVRYSGYGIRVAGGAQAVISRVQAIQNGVGVIALGPADDTSTATSLSISDSLATQSYIGFAATGQIYCSNCENRVHVSNSVASKNIYGISAERTGATLFASGNRAEKNTLYGMAQALSGSFNSAGNNVTIDNGLNTLGTITSIAGTVFH